MNCGGSQRDKTRPAPEAHLSSAELAAVAAMLGKVPTVAEYMDAVKGVEPMASDIYRYLSFDQIAEYREVADKVIPIKVA